MRFSSPSLPSPLPSLLPSPPSSPPLPSPSPPLHPSPLQPFQLHQGHAAEEERWGCGLVCRPHHLRGRDGLQPQEGCTQSGRQVDSCLTTRQVCASVSLTPTNYGCPVPLPPHCVPLPHLQCAPPTQLFVPPPPAVCPSPTTVSPSPCCSVHMKVSEKLSAVAGRDGGLDSFEVLGTSQQ